ncbi:hypothetical protein ACA910_004422 [Epithemia clementina (nom. ined.)]
MMQITSTIVLEKTQEQQQYRHHEIGELDILCSKDKSLSNHPGNRLFRELIEDAAASYGKATDKASKMKITKSIVDCLQNDHGCRFVKFDSDLAHWVELNPVESRDKVGHALRFAIRSHSKPTGRSCSSRESASKKTGKDNKRCKKTSSHSARSTSTSTSSTTSEATSSSTNTVSTAIQRESFQASSSSSSSIHRKPPISISMEKIQTARQKLDQIIQRQNDFLQSLNTEVAAALGSEFPCSLEDENGMFLSDHHSPSFISNPTSSLSFDLKNLSETTDLFTSKEFDFLVGDLEAI